MADYARCHNIYTQSTHEYIKLSQLSYYEAVKYILIQYYLTDNEDMISIAYLMNESS